MVRSVAGRQSNALYCPGARPAGTNGFVPRMNLWPETVGEIACGGGQRLDGSRGREALAVAGFQQEVKGKTLGALVGMPHSLGHIISSKLLGASMVAIPSVVFFCIGVLCNPDDFGWFMQDVVSEPGAWFFLSQVVLCLVLTTFYSLRVMRGAFALAVATLALGNMIYWMGATAISFGSMDPDPLAGFGLILSAGLCVVLANATVRRIRDVASEE